MSPPISLTVFEDTAIPEVELRQKDWKDAGPGYCGEG